MHNLAVIILVVARKGGETGASVAEISRAIHDRDLYNWPGDGSIPDHTGGSMFDQALLGLARLGFVTIESSTEREEWTRNHLAGADAERAASTRIRIGAGFSEMQQLLDFSLTEHASRNENSVIASPEFSLGRQTRFNVFVLMPFAERFLSMYESAILPACASQGKKCGRGDDFAGANYIIDDIWTAIYHADYIIADCTGQNANVFYELGIAHLLGRDALLITQEEADIPFDIRHRRYATYVNTPEGLLALKSVIERYLGMPSRIAARVRR